MTADALFIGRGGVGFVWQRLWVAEDLFVGRGNASFFCGGFYRQRWWYLLLVVVTGVGLIVVRCVGGEISGGVGRRWMQLLWIHLLEEVATVAMNTSFLGWGSGGGFSWFVGGGGCCGNVCFGLGVGGCFSVWQMLLLSEMAASPSDGCQGFGGGYHCGSVFICVICQMEVCCGTNRWVILFSFCCFHMVFYISSHFHFFLVCLPPSAIMATQISWSSNDLVGTD